MVDDVIAMSYLDFFEDFLGEIEVSGTAITSKFCDYLMLVYFPQFCPAGSVKMPLHRLTLS